MIKFNVASINCCTEVEGPHKRLAIWFQGCDISCKGCCNPDYQALIPKNIISLDNMLAIVKDSKDKHDIEGVTYLGGEPTLQNGLQFLTEKIKSLKLGVISFTGRAYEEVKDILHGCDIVIDGAFIENEMNSNRRSIGSDNQRIICLTNRYKETIRWYDNPQNKNLEINIGQDIIINGDPF